jgi:hypothetical protein
MAGFITYYQTICKKSTRVIVAVSVFVLVIVKGRLRLAGIVASAPPKVVKPQAAWAVSRRFVVHT